MGSIAKSFIQDLLAKTDIVTVISSYLPLKKSGGRFKACCPFHQEKTPSLHVHQRKQFYHCFGCHASGDVIRFVMDYQRIDFVAAVELLASRLGLDVPREGGSSPQIDAQDYQHMSAAKDFYVRQLASAALASKYLQQRGLSAQVIAAYALGFAPQHSPSLAQSLPSLSSQQGQHLGLINRRGGDYFFGPRIMFPIRDLRGRVVGFGGRTLTNQQPKYINSPETPLFHKSKELYGLYEVLQQNKDINMLLVVEGYMDVVSLAEHGVACAVATLGTAITRLQVQKCLRYTQKIVFAFDGDRAGRQAAWRALEASLPVLKPGVDLRFLFLPETEDPDSYVRQHGLEAWRKLLAEASELSDFFISNLLQQHPLDSMAQRSLFAEKSSNYLQLVPAGPCRQLLQEQAASALGSPINLDSASAMPSDNQPKAQQVVKVQSRLQQKPIWHALALLLAHPEWVSDVPADAWWLKGVSSSAMSLFVDVCQRFRADSELRANTLLTLYDEKTVAVLQRLVCWEPLLDDISALRQEWLGLLQKLQQSYLQQVSEQMIERAKQGQLSEQEKRDLADLLALRARVSAELD